MHLIVYMHESGIKESISIPDVYIIHTAEVSVYNYILYYYIYIIIYIIYIYNVKIDTAGTGYLRT